METKVLTYSKMTLLRLRRNLVRPVIGSAKATFSSASAATASSSSSCRNRGEKWWDVELPAADHVPSSSSSTDVGSSKNTSRSTATRIGGTLNDFLGGQVHQPTKSLSSASKGAKAFDDPFFSSLTKQMQRYVRKTAPTRAHEQEKDEFLVKLAKILESVVGDNAQVAPFGSVMNGFWTPCSDIDLCIRVPSGASTRAAQTKILKRVGNELARVSSHFIEPRFGAKVPIIHWAPRQPGMLSCDISVNNVLAVLNSRLVGEYVRLDKRVYEVGMCLKAWASTRGINDRSRGTLSSFSLILMLIHYLQDHCALLPSLQDLAIARNYPPVYVQGVDTRYCTDREQIADEIRFLQEKQKETLLRRHGTSDVRKLSSGYLLADFFKYYAYEYAQSGRTVAIRDVRSYASSSGASLSGGSTYLFIDNPFEIGKDVANVEVSLMRSIQRELHRGAHLLLSSDSTGTTGTGEDSGNATEDDSEVEEFPKSSVFEKLIEPWDRGLGMNSFLSMDYPMR
ncbi:unnamed protein product [Amoebophrya sp. A25]|nr:unnamed protein product [Amoebophrya sp. A25]|eukprot:GSA25T00021455001.1